ncbi:uncharacterized protein LOC113360290 [Papaver somniferum]|uniref:uncharacterized protein LOC113360290 n=1 Tax=Papaver somniferum TaxID=3469 RepID=UPI000E6FD56A|nr:uncharacterized protein LOC113360290 [Papaver somniferum]
MVEEIPFSHIASASLYYVVEDGPAQIRLKFRWIEFMVSQEHVSANLTRAQIIDAVTASANLQIRKDIPGLVAFISRWCADTHTVVCRWGEMTFSLKSVALLLNLTVTRNLNIQLTEDEEKMRATLVAKSKDFVRRENEKCFYSWWVSQWFPDELDPSQKNSTLHVAAFLVLWLSRDVFDDGSSKKKIRQELLMIAIKLDKGVVLPIGSLFLGSLYTHLDHLVADMRVSNGYMKVDLYVHVTFLQAWLWEHFEKYASKPLPSLPAN